jgi:hypothetical protein
VRNAGLAGDVSLGNARINFFEKLFRDNYPGIINFILGTVASQDEWKQKRHLVAFWANGPAPTAQDLLPAGFKVGMCLDESNEELSMSSIPGEQIHFYSQQVKDAALAVLATTANVPGQVVSTLVFDEDAEIDAKDGSSPLRIQDGTITAYLYPVTVPTRSVQYAVLYKTYPMPNGQDFYGIRKVPYSISRVMRFWNSCDGFGNVRVMAYLVVFRPSISRRRRSKESRSSPALSVSPPAPWSTAPLFPCRSKTRHGAPASRGCLFPAAGDSRVRIHPLSFLP